MQLNVITCSLLAKRRVSYSYSNEIFLRLRLRYTKVYRIHFTMPQLTILYNYTVGKYSRPIFNVTRLSSYTHNLIICELLQYRLQIKRAITNNLSHASKTKSGN